MRSNLFLKQGFFVCCLVSLSLTACASAQETTVSSSIPSSTPETTPTAIQAATATPLTEKPVTVAFFKDGDIHLWDSITNQTQTLAKTGDVALVMMSNDGQVIVFTRRSWVGDVFDGYEQFALWAMNRDGGNPRELVSAQTLRQQLNSNEHESTGFAQISWVPQTHRLLYSGWKYIVQGEGTSHASPEGVYVVDTETASIRILVEAGDTLRFVPSPDGRQVALMSTDGLSFINVDDPNSRRDAVTYPAVGEPGRLLPNGVWTQDSQAFVFTSSIENSLNPALNYTILSIPTDGSTPQTLAAINDTHSDSVSFSPDGQYIGFGQGEDFFITPLTPAVGSLVLPYYGKESFYANLHWSPAGIAYVIKDQDLLQLCPNATQDSEICGEPIHLGSNNLFTSIHWVDSEHFLFRGLEPSTLSLGNVDGMMVPIATWTDDDVLSGWSFYTPH